MGTETRRAIISLTVLVLGVLLIVVLVTAVNKNTERNYREAVSTGQALATDFYAEQSP